jgi:hypothetical protein
MLFVMCYIFSGNNSVAVFKLYLLFLCIYQRAYSKQIVAVRIAAFIMVVPGTSFSQDIACSY